MNDTAAMRHWVDFKKIVRYKANKKGVFWSTEF